MISVLMVCLGNICRSPMAEAVFQHQVNQAGLGAKIRVDSAGTGDYHIGEEAHPRTLATLKQHNIPYNNRARLLTIEDLDKFDYVLGMDKNNLLTIRHYAQQAHKTPHTGLFLHHAYENAQTQRLEVPDPYYTGEYPLVYELVTVGSEALLAHIRAEHGL